MEENDEYSDGRSGIRCYSFATACFVNLQLLAMHTVHTLQEPPKSHVHHRPQLTTKQW